MRIGIDIDNVISNFDEVLQREFLKHDKTLRNHGIINENLYITEGMFDWSKEEISDFYHSNIERIVKDLTVIDGAKEYIDKLKEEGHAIYLITGRDNGEYSNPVNMTVDWLKQNHITYDKLIFTNSNDKESKAKACIEHHIDIMIDDSVHICQACIHAGVMTLIMDKPCNRNCNIKRVYSWKDIYIFIHRYKQPKLNVILDTDTYNECDDQFALAYMIRSQDIFNIEAITIAPFSRPSKHVTTVNSQELSYHEVLKICKLLDFDTTDKVFKGSLDYMQNNYDDNNDAVNKIIEISLKNNKTYIMAIGAITNVALAIKKEPKIVDRIEIIWLGGHSLLQNNNLEFNFQQDVKAVQTVFSSTVKLTVIPCKNVASNLVTSVYELEHHLKNKNELCNYLIQRFCDDGYTDLRDRRVIWDISVIAYLINPEWFQTNQIHSPKISDDTSYIMTHNQHYITFVNYLDVNNIYRDLFGKLGGVYETIE